ncbi:hypothetical protein, partial [Stutzerimonas nitrititolerans]|uniref:hypothetical protein n=1 Tax=Stutzerimonas nitrititolerans TaxID=2482751 RepID=UPI0028B04BBB
MAVLPGEKSAILLTGMRYGQWQGLSRHPLRNPRHLQSAKPNRGVPRMKIVVAMTLLSLATG